MSLWLERGPDGRWMLKEWAATVDWTFVKDVRKATRNQSFVKKKSKALAVIVACTERRSSEEPEFCMPVTIIHHTLMDASGSVRSRLGPPNQDQLVCCS